MWQQLVTRFANHCAPESFFGIPQWHKYLYPDYINHVNVRGSGPICEYDLSFVTGGALNLEPLALIFLGILDILLRIGALVAVGFIIYGGIQYVLSQGEPDKAKKAFGTILNAAIGLGITIVAAAIVSFIGRAVAS